MSPGPRDMRPMPHSRGEAYPPTFSDSGRMKREFRKPSPDVRRRSRSMSPPPKKRHPPSPGPGYRGASPPRRGRRSMTPPPPNLRRSRTRTPPRKQRGASPPSRSGSHRMGGDSRRSVEGHPDDFYGPWGTRIATHDLRKITVDIKRNLPKGKRSNSPIIRRIINADDIGLYRRSGEGSRPLWDRSDMRGAVNRRFEEASASGPNEPRVVAIIREPGHGGGGSRREGSPYERRSRSRERDFAPMERPGLMERPALMERPPQARPASARPAPMPVGERIDRDRTERTQRQVEKLEQMESAIDRKLEQIQRYEKKYEETVRDEKYGDDRKLVDRSVRDRLGPKRPREGAPGEYSGEPRESRPLPDFSQRPNKPPVWGAPDPPSEYYAHESRDNGYRGRGRGGYRSRGRGNYRGRGRFSPTSWQHDKYESYN